MGLANITNTHTHTHTHTCTYFIAYLFLLLLLLFSLLCQELRLDEFVTHEVSFEDINKAFDLLNEGHCLRCVIRMDK